MSRIVLTMMAAAVLAMATTAHAAACASSVQNCATNQCSSTNSSACQQCVTDYYVTSGACAQCSTCGTGYTVETACSTTQNTVCRMNAFASGRVQLKVIGQSGKFDLIPENEDGSLQTSNKLRIEMDSLYELDSSGNKIGTSGPQSGKHSKNTFATESFTITGPTTTTYGGLDVKRVTFSVDILSATLNMYTYMFTEGGNITLGPSSGSSVTQETFSVVAGSVKFNVEVDNWPFCAGASGNPCNGATGADLELTIGVSGPSTATKTTNGNGDEVYDFGEGASMQLSNLFEIGGVYEDAGTGDVDFSGTSLKLRFRKPTGSNKLMKYDPILSFDFNAASSTAVSVTVLVAAMALVSMALAMFQ